MKQPVFSIPKNRRGEGGALCKKNQKFTARKEILGFFSGGNGIKGGMKRKKSRISRLEHRRFYWEKRGTRPIRIEKKAL